MHFFFIRELEAAGKLDRENEIDLYCLRFVFLHLIQDKVDGFKKEWNTHRLRTVGNFSPQQLYNLGLHKLEKRAKKEKKKFPELDQVCSIMIFCSACKIIANIFSRFFFTEPRH